MGCLSCGTASLWLSLFDSPSPCPSPSLNPEPGLELGPDPACSRLHLEARGTEWHWRGLEYVEIKSGAGAVNLEKEFTALLE